MKPFHLRSTVSSAALALWCVAVVPAQELASLPGIATRLQGGGVPESLDDWSALEARFVTLCARVRPAVVTIGGGSGVIVGDKLVLTAAHVIEEPGRELKLILDDGRRVDAVALGVNSASDTGLVRITTAGEFPHCEMGSFDSVHEGNWCFLLGHPGGRHAAGPPLRIGRVMRAEADRWLVTDCTIEAGDSGGPLFDLDGKVIGIHSRITADLANNMHVPIAAFAREWRELLASEKTSRRKRSATYSSRWLNDLGATLTVVDDTFAVDTVAADSEAARAGLTIGDVLLQVDGREAGDGKLPLPRRPLSGAVTLKVRRGDEIVELKLPMVPARGPRTESGTADPALPPGPDLRRGVDGFARGSRNEYPIVDTLAPVVHELFHSVVRVTVDEREVALGTIVRADGLIVTKGSEVGGGRIRCVLADGTQHVATRVANDLVDDLTLLKIDTDGLQPIEWSDQAPEPGRIIVTPTEEDTPVAYGVISLPAYKPRTRARGGAAPGELGALFAAGSKAPRILSIREGSAAEIAGLKIGDLITEIDDIAIATRDQVVESMRSRHEGESVEIHVERDGSRVVVDAKLVLRRGSPPPMANPQEPLWGPLSTVRSGFTGVLAHDTVLAPDRCGGPIVTLDGHAVGLNISRTGRVETTALPVDVVREVTSRLITQSERK